MNVQWHAHLPGVVLDGDGGMRIGPGRLVHLPFTDWSKLDSTFSFNDRQYEESRPVFYSGAADLVDPSDLGESHVLNCVSRLHTAFLLHPDAPLLPSPHMSVIYLQVEVSSLPGAVSWRRIIGPFEREWIVFGSRVTYHFDDSQLAVVRSGYEALEGFDATRAFSGVESSLRTLEVTTRPEFWWDGRSLNKINEFVHCIAALEHILLPAREDTPAEMKRTPTFGEHAAVFTSPSRDDLQERARFFSTLYRLRSRLLHGELGITELEEEDLKLLSWGRRLLCDVILRVVILGRTRSGDEMLSPLLARAYKNAEAHHTLNQRFEQAQTR